MPEHRPDPPATAGNRMVSGNIPWEPAEDDGIPATEAVPFHVLVSDARRAEALDAEEAAEHLAERRAKADAEADERIRVEQESAEERMREGEPPDDLDVNTEGLPPQRARLLRLDTWMDRHRFEIAEAEHARVRLLETIGVPAATRSALDALIASDKTGLLSWALGTGDSPAVNPPQARSFERKALEAKLASDAHAAETALGVYDDLGKKVDRLQAELAVLESRRESFVRAALDECAAATLSARYAEQIEALRATCIEANGHRIAAGRQPIEVDTPLPDFRLDGTPSRQGEIVDMTNAPARPRLRATEHEARAASGRWKAIAARIAADPRANPEEDSQCP